MIDRRVRLVIDLFENEPATSFSIAGLSRLFHVSGSHLEHLFKRDTGMTIREFILRTRLNKAAGLLGTTDEHVRQICFAVGFSDVSNFNHAFKRTYGVSPREYRMRIMRTRFPRPED